MDKVWYRNPSKSKTTQNRQKSNAKFFL